MTAMMSGTVKEAGTTPRFARSAATTSTRLVFHVVREAGIEVSRTFVAPGDVIRIGANETNDVVLADPTVSRFHARIERTPRSWRLVDQESMNGTRVDGVTMRDGDLPLPQCKLELGDSLIVVGEEDAAVPTKIETLDQASFGDLYGSSLPMRRLFAMLDRVCASEANVLIEGASGTGKELVATEIVRRGPRRKGPFVIVDCSAIAPSVLESELFGHVRGAFTGAERDRVGAFEAAQHGTIFLDEIGELPLDMQPKLLRALEAGEIRRVGETRTRKIDVRVVAATNRCLEREVNHARFREDLYFRLSVVTLRVPPLRERLDDLELLVAAILESLDAAERMPLFTPALFADMRRYDWPGNVRELRNFVERTIVMGGLRQDAPPAAAAAPAGDPTIDLEKSFRDGKEDVIVDYERRYLRELLEWAGGNVTKAARKARIDRMSLYRLMQRHQTTPEREPKE
ncbi:MAG: sigma 54-interacting transcriptional regulator [Labilithrix sp.]|nr:sigma 54-interacting transcriptional regulator [Labilithrix sp.]MCW5809367.1 sigma 54-interacting transcriptional regulator [Labilithrix sp.]